MTILRVCRKCNERCVFCNIDEKDAFNSYYETPAEVEAFLDETHPNKRDVIEISGGEPTLNPQLPDIVKVIKRKGYRVIMESNAILLADITLVLRLAEAGLDDTFISLHAANELMSDAITGHRGAFEKTCCGIDNLIAHGIDVTINYVWFRGNMTHLPFFARWLKNRFGNSIELHLSIIAPNFSDKVEEFIFRLSEVEPILHEAVKVCEDVGLSFKVADMCGLPLCFMRGIEHIYVDPLLFIPPSVEAQLREKVKGPQCESCVHNKHCAGVWKQYAALYGTDELKPVAGSSTPAIQVKSALRSPITYYAVRYLGHRLANAARRGVRGWKLALKGS